MKASLKSLLKVCIFISLAVLSVNVYAYYSCYYNGYIGNPNRPYTMWIPGHYDYHGCWIEGHYIKFIRHHDCYRGCYYRGCYYNDYCYGCGYERLMMNDHYMYGRPMMVVGTVDTF